MIGVELRLSEDHADAARKWLRKAERTTWQTGETCASIAVAHAVLALVEQANEAQRRTEVNR